MPKVFKSEADQRIDEIARIVSFSISALESAADELNQITNVSSNLEIIVQFDRRYQQTQNYISEIPEPQVQETYEARLVTLADSLDSTFSRFNTEIEYEVNQIMLEIQAVAAWTLAEYERLFGKLFRYQTAVGMSLLPEDTRVRDRWKLAFDDLEAGKLTIP